MGVYLFVWYLHTYTGVKEWVRGRLEAVRKGLQTHENEVERIVRQVRQQHLNPTPNYTQILHSRKLNLNPKVLPKKMPHSPLRHVFAPTPDTVLSEYIYIHMYLPPGWYLVLGRKLERKVLRSLVLGHKPVGARPKASGARLHNFATPILLPSKPEFQKYEPS